MAPLAFVWLACSGDQNEARPATTGAEVLRLGDCNAPFADPSKVLDFHIRMKSVHWNTLLADRVRNLDDYDRVACEDAFKEFAAEFRCGTEEPWIKIAVRKKRGEERSALPGGAKEVPGKPPLKLDFNEDFMGFQPEARGQAWPRSMGELGYRKLTLNNGQSNALRETAMRLPVLLQEHVTLRMLHTEVPSAPATAYATVTLHLDDAPPQHNGIYILIEDIDKPAIRRRWGETAGRLLKQSKSACAPEVVYEDVIEGMPNQAIAAFAAWRSQDPGAFPGTWYQETEKGFEVEDTLRQEAVREVLLNGDDTLFYASLVSGEGNNWMAFEPIAGKRRYMPWDVDLSFGQQQDFCRPTPFHCAPTFPILPFCTGAELHPENPNRSVSKSVVGLRTACNDQVQKRYLEVMCQLTQGSLSAENMLKVWDQTWNTVRPLIPLEKHLWQGADLTTGQEDKSVGGEYVRLREWLPRRIQSVQQQITQRGVPCSPGCQNGAREACTHLQCAGERRCENNAWTPCSPAATCAQRP